MPYRYGEAGVDPGTSIRSWLRLADWLVGRDLPDRTRPRITVTVASVGLVTQGAAAGARPTATFAASIGSTALSSLTFGSSPGSLGIYEASLSGSVTLDPAATGAPSTTTVPLAFRLDSSGNLSPPAGASSGPVGSGPAGSIDEAKLRDVVVLLTARLGTATTTP